MYQLSLLLHFYHSFLTYQNGVVLCTTFGDKNVEEIKVDIFKKLSKKFTIKDKSNRKIHNFYNNQ